MEVDRQGLEVLTRAQCLRLVGGSRIGRVVVSLGSLPAAFPVNFALLDDDVVFRSAAGTKLSAALDETVVAFEVDRIDPVQQSGWSVLIQGRATVITAPAELDRARRLKIRPWVPGELPHFIRIQSQLVSGRRLPASADELALAFSPNGFHQAAEAFPA